MQFANNLESNEILEEIQFDSEEVPQLKHDVEQTKMSDAERVNVRVRDNVRNLDRVFDWNPDMIRSDGPLSGESLHLTDDKFSYDLERVVGDGGMSISLDVHEGEKSVGHMSFAVSSNGSGCDATYDFPDGSHEESFDDYKSANVDIERFRKFEDRFQKLYQDLLN